MKTKLLLLLFMMSIAVDIYGQFWTEQNSNFDNNSRGISQFSIANENVIWATGYDGSSTGENVQEMTKSIDGGETWSSINIDLGPGTLGLGISNIFALDENIAWVSAYPNTQFDIGGIWKTTDGGITWFKQASALYNNTASFANVVYFWDANIGFCQGDPISGFYELYTTTDGGANWIRVPSTNIPIPLPGEYGYVRQIEVVGNRLWWTTNKGRIYRSDDYGLNWEVFQSPISDFGGANTSGNISFWNANDGLLASRQGQLFNTNNGGETWNVMTGVDASSTDIECIVGTDIAIFTGSNGQSGSNYVANSSYSIDGGNSWVLIDNIQRIELESKGDLLLAGGFTSQDTPPTGGVFKYTGTELPLSIQNNNLSILTAYPNPVKDTFTIEAVDVISKVTVFNMLGQEVLNVTPNVNTAKIDMTNLTSGSYVVKVLVNDNTQTIKLVK